MGAYKTKIVNNIICSKVDGELDASLSYKWIEKLEEQEKGKNLNRFHDVRGINAVHLSFDDLWAVAQRRMEAYESGEETLTAFWVSTPLNYGVASMYQALTEGTPFEIKVLYKIEDAADFLGVDKKILEDIVY